MRRNNRSLRAPKPSYLPVDLFKKDIVALDTRPFHASKVRQAGALADVHEKRTTNFSYTFAGMNRADRARVIIRRLTGCRMLYPEPLYSVFALVGTRAGQAN